jgi:hypothetical protein
VECSQFVREGILSQFVILRMIEIEVDGVEIITRAMVFVSVFSVSLLVLTVVTILTELVDSFLTEAVSALRCRDTLERVYSCSLCRRRSARG